MSSDEVYTNEPVVDSGARYRIGEPSQDEIEDHRSKPSMLIGLPTGEGTALHVSFTPSTQAGHRHRRRRKHEPVPIREDGNKTPTDPSDHVMFLLGECDGEEGQAHQLFCELDELWHDSSGSGETEWREAARWIKFEEVVEENGERWSKPHVATLSLYSVFELRNCLANGLIMLNLEAYTMEQIADLMLNVLVSDDRLPADMRESVNEILLRRHVHLHERIRRTLGARSASNLPIIRSLADIGKRHSSKDVEKEMTSQPSLAKLASYTGIDSLDPAIAAHVAAHAQAQTSHSEVMTGSLQGKVSIY